MKNYIKTTWLRSEEVEAILDNRKRTFRRIVIPQPKCKLLNDNGKYYQILNEYTCPGINKNTLFSLRVERKKRYRPTYQIGDIIALKETWYYDSFLEDTEEGNPDLKSGNYSFRYIYRSDNRNYPVDYDNGSNGWNDPRNMPFEAIRIFLKITDISLERLQDITEEGTIKEGIYKLPKGDLPESSAWTFVRDYHDGFIKYRCYPEYLGPINCYKHMWDMCILDNQCEKIKTYGWEANPYVWVYEFERVSKEYALNTGFQLKVRK